MNWVHVPIFLARGNDEKGGWNDGREESRSRFMLQIQCQNQRTVYGVDNYIHYEHPYIMSILMSFYVPLTCTLITAASMEMSFPNDSPVENPVITKRNWLPGAVFVDLIDKNFKLLLNNKWGFLMVHVLELRGDLRTLWIGHYTCRQQAPRGEIYFYCVFYWPFFIKYTIHVSYVYWVKQQTTSI